MKERIKKGFGIICLVVSCLGIGYLFGHQAARKDLEALEILKKDIISMPEEENSTEIIYNDTVAIVNLDVGIQQDNDWINYGAKLLHAVDGDIQSTSLEKARSGIKTGEYSAYLIIPSTFSKNVTTMNYRPHTTEFQYAIGMDLKGETRDAAIYKIQSIYQTFRDSLSQIYVSSILQDYHTAQDNAVTIMERDKADLAALLEISLEDLVELVELPEMETTEQSVEPLDIDKYSEDNNQALAELSESYQNALDRGNEELDAIKDEMSELVTEGNNLTNRISEMSESLQNQEDIEWDEADEIQKENEEYARIKNNLVGSEKAQEPTEPEEPEPEEPTVSGNDTGEDNGDDQDPTDTDEDDDYNSNDYYYDIYGKGMLLVWNEQLVDYKDKVGTVLDKYKKHESAHIEEIKYYRYKENKLWNQYYERNSKENIKNVIDEEDRQIEADNYNMLFYTSKEVSAVNSKTAAIVTADITQWIQEYSDWIKSYNRETDQFNQHTLPEGGENVGTGLENTDLEPDDIKQRIDAWPESVQAVLQNEYYWKYVYIRVYKELGFLQYEDKEENLLEELNSKSVLFLNIVISEDNEFSKIIYPTLDTLYSKIEDSAIELQIPVHVATEKDGAIDEIVPIDEEVDFESVSVNEIPLADVEEVSRQIDGLIQVAKDGNNSRFKEIQENIVTFRSLKDTLIKQVDDTEASNEIFQTSQQKINKDLSDYDLQSFVNNDKIDSLYTDIGKNSDSMLAEIGKYTQNNEEYIERLFELSDKNMEIIQESIEKGQEKSEEKLQEGLRDAKDLRAKNSEENVLMLEDLTKKLPYTRVGELENKEVYEFISNPIYLTESVQTDKEAKNSVDAINQNVRREAETVGNSQGKTSKWIIIIIPIGAIILLYVLGGIILFKRGRTEEY